jgi:hypothetical protein
VLVTSPTANLSWPGIATDGINSLITYQRVTGSVWEAFAARVGTTTGGLIEQVTAYSNPNSSGYHPAVCRSNRGYGIAYATDESPTSLNPIYGRVFQMPAASSTTYGSNCGGTISTFTLPFAGHGAYDVYLGGAPPAGVAALLLGTARSAIPLSALGFGPCHLNVSPVAVSLPATVDTSGTASLRLPLPDNPPIIGDLFFQWAYPDARVAWPAQFAFTSGLQAAVR